MTRLSILLRVLLALGSGSIAAAQSVSFSGEIRERSEVDGKSPVAGAKPDIFHLLRSRLGATVTIDDRISARIEMQDARLFGQNGAIQNPGAPALDLRQGYLDIRNIGGTTLGVRLGRQVLGYANERLISRSDWGNTGQSFDAVVASGTIGDVKVDALGAVVARLGTAANYERDVFLAGLWGAWSPDSNRTSVQGFYLFDDPRNAKARQNRHTAGLYARGSAGPVDAEIDGAVQMGEYIEPDIRRKLSASLIGLRAGYTFDDLGNLRLGLGYDRLSGHPGIGSPDRGEFSTMYGTTHKFYGLIDYFPPTTGYGLQDLMLVVDVKPVSSLGLALELHQFLTATDPVKFGFTYSNQIGRELDLVATYKPARALSLQGGFALFDGAPDRVLILGRAITTWGYLMTTLSF